MKSVCIVVPVYKEVLNIFEEISFKQLCNVLSVYSIILVGPDSLNTGSYDEIAGRKLKKEDFFDSYFKNKATYSQLLLTEQFYKRFDDFDYMLIYQLDAFVFSDRLAEFIDMGYDYIGAPLISDEWSRCHVGNGGFSLRKIDRTRKLVEKKEMFSIWKEKKEYFLDHEDYFFACCGIDDKIDYFVPEPMLATLFSAQSDCYDGMTLISKRGVPFGTHHFPDWNYDFWKPYVELYGYKLPSVNEVNFKNTFSYRNISSSPYYFIDFLKSNKNIEPSFIAQKIGFTQKKYGVYGAGKWGKAIIELLKYIGVEDVRVFDQAGSRKNVDIKIDYPIQERLSELRNDRITIIIGSERYEKEIEEILVNIGFSHGDGYIRFSDFIMRWESIEDECKKVYGEIYDIC